MDTGLYLVSTPIGNLGDITLRALETLAGCNLIACEDTRTSGVLLARYGIRTPKISYNEHNASRRDADLLRRIGEGQAVALISDAGTPLISDPGSRLVTSVIDGGFSVTPIPGVSAPIAALVASGLPNDEFVFGGFLPNKQGARIRRLEEFARISATLVFFESPKRLAASLADMVDVYGSERRAAVAREITKMHETFYRDTLSGLAGKFAADGAPKGEIVILIDAAPAMTMSDADIDRALTTLLADNSTKYAATLLADQTGLSKRTLYQRALSIGENNEKRK